MAQEYLEELKVDNLPHLALEGNIDLTYRCNNNCRHCWLRIPSDDSRGKEELSFEEIKHIVQDAQRMGCRRWSMSGGEPMLRPDFSEIFDYITSHSNSYTINTNGTLITTKIAGLMKRKGQKLVSLYGATAETHDWITRTPGSFEATMRGFTYLKEAGADFTVQLIPMRDNYHQFKEMLRLAESLSKSYRIGAAWLYLSAYADQRKNKEIRSQRLSPADVLELNKPYPPEIEQCHEEKNSCDCGGKNQKYLFASCIEKRRSFYIDPYAKMTFCCFIKDVALRCDLRKGSFQECWEKFIPSLAYKVKVTEEYRKNCGACALRNYCRACPVYAYLEHRRFTAKVDYLCAVAKESQKYGQDWLKNHRRYFKIAGITIELVSALPITDDTFHVKFKLFQVSKPQGKTILISHHFAHLDLDGKDLGNEVYRNPPWAIYKKDGSWIYLGILPQQEDKRFYKVAVFNSDHTRVEIYNGNDGERIYRKGNCQALTLFASDQILLARILADRQGFYLHACGVILKGKGLLFAGHSEAGKSTMAKMLKGKAEILNDDRIIIRKNSDGFRAYGTWSHGDVPDISSHGAPLKAIMFLEKSDENRIIPLRNKKEITKRLLSYLVKPFITTDWWEKVLALIEKVVEQTPCYILKFDKSGNIVELLERL